MRINSIQNNNTTFCAKIIPNKTFYDFSRAVEKTKSEVRTSHRGFHKNIEARFEDAVNRLRKMRGETELEMYSYRAHDLETCVGHGGLGLQNLSTGKRIASTGPLDDPFMKQGGNDNVMESFIGLVNKLEKSEDFWEGSAPNYRNSIVNRLIK